jgi:hypothetical protein
MAWIKRNLFFFIGTIVALALIGLGAWYFYAEYTAEGEFANKIAEDYDTLQQLNQQPLQPGKPGGNPDNVQVAMDQQTAIRSWIESTRPFFQPIRPSGDLNDFPSRLDNTVAKLQRKAADNGVTLPANYYFTFQAQRNMLAIPFNVLPQLATRLGEIEALCNMLFDAKVNSLEFVRREMLSADDTNAVDYLPPDQRTTSTPLAELTPYEITFDCFSGELATFMSSLAASPHSFVIKSINVEPAAPGGAMMGYAPAPAGMPAQLPYDGGHFRRPMPPPGQGAMPAPRPEGMPAPPPPNGRPVKFLGEHILRITLFIEVVKPKPGK